MLSKEIKQLYDEGKIEEIYKRNLKYFQLIDSWADKLIGGDLLDEYELSSCMEQLNGCQSKLNPIAGCLEAMLIEYENRYIVKEEDECEKDRIQDQNSCKAKARVSASDLRRYASDFTRYTYSCQNTVTVAQSRLKRLSVEKGNKGVDFVGEAPQGEKKEDNGWGK
ncbi:hypothetical protein LCGC14_2167610 [marine sediment metagenome]|uniref:Uncharacterized protein n=1 Tax=marine sediment metagenome TaxID=412755 RepID=A0A0F9ED61_9ZZZZ